MNQVYFVVLISDTDVYTAWIQIISKLLFKLLENFAIAYSSQNGSWKGREKVNELSVNSHRFWEHNPQIFPYISK
jgi:hypothetical protein